MVDSFREKCEENGISPVVGVILLVAIVVILAAVVGILALGFGDNLTDSSTAAVTVENGKARLIDMGNSEKVIVKSENGSIKENLTQAGDSTPVRPDYTIISVSEDGSKNVIKPITDNNVGDYTELDVRFDTDRGKNLDLTSGEKFNITTYEAENNGDRNVAVDFYLEDLDGDTLITYDTNRSIDSGEVYEVISPSNIPLEIEVTNLDLSNSTAKISDEFGSTITLDLDSNNNSVARLVAEGQDSEGNNIKFTGKINLSFSN